MSWSSATRRIRSTKVDPRVDNALKITTDGRKLALDGRMLSPDAEDFPGSKINALVENVVAIWRETADKRSTPDDFLRYGRQPDTVGLFRLRRRDNEAGESRHSPAMKSPASAMPTPTPRSACCSRRYEPARCAC